MTCARRPGNKNRRPFGRVQIQQAQLIDPLSVLDMLAPTLKAQRNSSAVKLVPVEAALIPIRSTGRTKGWTQRNADSENNHGFSSLPITNQSRDSHRWCQVYARMREAL
jgi:hypothetical protein